MQRNEKTLIVAAGMLLLSILLMIVVIPGVYSETLPNSKNLAAVIGISLAIIIRLLIFIAYRWLIKNNWRNNERIKRRYIVLGILLIVFGILYSDGAFAFLNNEKVLYVSFLMFSSVFCDIIASILTIIAFFLKLKEIKQGDLSLLCYK